MSKPNVLLLVMDSVRAANVSLYGHEHETTPYLETLADEATVYEQARSPGTWSLPSHTSMFTGYHVMEHGMTRARYQLDPGHTVWERLSDEHGYDTGVFSENTWITDMPVGLRDAFDTVEGARNLLFPDAIDPSNFVLSEGQGEYVGFLKHCLERDDTVRSLANGAYTKVAWDFPHLLPERFKAKTDADVYVDLFLDWESSREGPWAACINLMDGHLPYLPDQEHDKWGGKRLRNLQDEMDDQVWEFNGGQRPWWQRRALEGLYDGTIHQMDSEIERLVSSLRSRGVLDDTLLVVTSDHGEGFGEVSHVRPEARISGHGNGIHDCLLHVPLLVRLPGGGDGERVESVASLTEFPRVAQSAVDGDGSKTFVPEGPVLASSRGLEEPMEKRASKYCEDIWRFDGDANAVYSDANDDAPGVEVALGWREYRTTVRTVSPRCSYEISDDDTGVVDGAFSDVEDLGVRGDSDGYDDIDSATQERLKDLGYM